VTVVHPAEVPRMNKHIMSSSKMLKVAINTHCRKIISKPFIYLKKSRNKPEVLCDREINHKEINYAAMILI
jgi:hypothetical protein